MSGRRSEHRAVLITRMPDPFKIYMNAERYRIADAALRSDHYRDIQTSVAAPAMVLSAFAAELYFKCIIALETEKQLPQTHDLDALYRKLTPTSRKRLDDLWGVLAASPLMARVCEAMFVTTGERVPTDLAWYLKNGANAFVRLRYTHEDDGIGTSFMLVDLPEMLRTIVLEMKPEWRHVRHGIPKQILGFGPLTKPAD